MMMGRRKEKQLLFSPAASSCDPATNFLNVLVLSNLVKLISWYIFTHVFNAWNEFFQQAPPRVGEEVVQVHKDATAEISMTFGNWSKSNITQTLSILFIRHRKQTIWEAIRRLSVSHHNVTLMHTATYLVKWKLLSEPTFPFWEIGHGNGTQVKFFTHTKWFRMILNILHSKKLLRVWWKLLEFF